LDGSKYKATPNVYVKWSISVPSSSSPSSSPPSTASVPDDNGSGGGAEEVEGEEAGDKGAAAAAAVLVQSSSSSQPVRTDSVKVMMTARSRVRKRISIDVVHAEAYLRMLARERE
jgi:hypothetical protein